MLNMQIAEELNHRALVDLYSDALVHKVVGSGFRKDRLKRVHHTPRDWDCLKGAMTGVEKFCGRFDDYSLKYQYLLVNMCEEGFTATQITRGAQEVCTM